MASKTASFSSAVIILDFGSQYTQLIARRVRKLKLFCLVLPCYTELEVIKRHHPSALILAGGPASTYSELAPKYSPALFSLPVPMLGICYGMQVMLKHFGGTVGPAKQSEYGHTLIKTSGRKDLFYKGLKAKKTVWMSHLDQLLALGAEFEVTARSEGGAIASVRAKKLPLYGVQFHPEVSHTEEGEKMLSNFLFGIAKLKQNWDLPSFVEVAIKEIREKVGNRKVLLGLSGGVDSSALALLLHRAIGPQLECVFVDNGLLQDEEEKNIMELLCSEFQLSVRVISAGPMFLRRLWWIKKPEAKRRLIGKIFLKVFLRWLRKNELLAQGTLYPDVIESVSTTGPSDKIKTHHNRVKPILSLVKKNRVLEPFKNLFKDEVRAIALSLGLPKRLAYRHPFPGPGLAVRIVGRVTKQRLACLRRADAILREELKRARLYKTFWQAFAVLLPLGSVGVRGDRRAYGYTIALRIVKSVDGMTADFELLSKPLLRVITGRITGEIKEITRVVLDVTSKPPATIEWE